MTKPEARNLGVNGHNRTAESGKAELCGMCGTTNLFVAYTPSRLQQGSVLCRHYLM